MITPDSIVMRGRGRATTAIALGGVLLLACSRRAPDPADTARNAQTREAPAVPARDTGAVLALEGEGLRIFLMPSGVARPLPFGASRPAVLAAVAASQGHQAPELGNNLECRLTVARWPASGLTLSFSTDSAQRFVGWSVGDRAPGESSASRPSTASGIGPGSTRAALESTYVARVARSTLGVEFSAGGMAGLLESGRQDARITHLWAGQVCLAR